jgi:hypothetical protein
MKPILLLAAAVLTCAGVGAASAATVNTSLWSAQGAPGLSSGVAGWSTPSATAAGHPSNGSGALVSDFLLSGDFSFSGSVVPTGIDDDNIGVVVGWSDPSNNIRMGFESGGFGDCGTQACPFPRAARGFWIMEEIGGTPTLLYEQPSFDFTSGQSYDFTLTAIGGALSFDFGSGGSSIFSGSVAPAAPLTGRVGIYVESQSADFSGLTVSEAAVVPLPAGAPLLLAALGALGLAGRRRR